MLFKKISAAKIRVLLDGGGKKVVGGVETKFPSRWADFRNSEVLEITNPEDIARLKGASGYGKDFVAIPKKFIEEKKEVKKEIKNPLKDKVALVED